MSSVIDALYQLKYNPFKYGEHIASFYSTIQNVEKNLLLAPLIIPLCTHPTFGTSLSSAVFGEKKKSSIWTIFNDRAKLYDLQERISEFQSLTEQCIQFCLTNDWLTIDDKNLSLEYITTSDQKLTPQKNAANFGKLVSGHSVIELYAFLGVKPR